MSLSLLLLLILLLFGSLRTLCLSRPVHKVSTPAQHADFRPISITPVLTRVMERTIVEHFLYPAFLSPPQTLSFSDQFAFRPTGSPAAAIISLLHSITNLLISNPYVLVISLDFSKAFDTVRHCTLLEKLAQLDIPDNAYNWLVDFFGGHSHCTVYTVPGSDVDSEVRISQYHPRLKHRTGDVCGQCRRPEGRDSRKPPHKIRRRHLPYHLGKQRGLAVRRA